jgi:NAD+ diphosphatase
MANAVHTPALPYNGLLLDRTGGRRADPAYLAALRSRDDAVVLPFWRDGCLAGETPLSLADLPDMCEPVLLGLDDDVPIFAVDLSTMDETDAVALTGADGVLDVRRLFATVDAQRAALLAYARGILHWNRNQRYCGACGAPAQARDGGHLRVCTGCGKLLFPRIEPAVIVLVDDGEGRCLLGRHRGAAAGNYSTLAGFVEIGECLEDAVRRELFEEAGVHVGEVTYQASQAWPFPAGLMLGFRARALSHEVQVDAAELIEARWFTRDEVTAMFDQHVAAGTHRGDSIEAHLVGGWLAEVS